MIEANAENLGDAIGGFAAHLARVSESDHNPVAALTEWGPWMETRAKVQGALDEWADNLSRIAAWLRRVYPACAQEIEDQAAGMLADWVKQRAALVAQVREKVDAWYGERQVRLDYLAYLRLADDTGLRREMIEIIEGIAAIQEQGGDALRAEIGVALSDEEWQRARGPDLDLRYYRDVLEHAEEQAELADALREFARSA